MPTQTTERVRLRGAAMGNQTLPRCLRVDSNSSIQREAANLSVMVTNKEVRVRKAAGGKALNMMGINSPAIYLMISPGKDTEELLMRLKEGSNVGAEKLTDQKEVLINTRN